MEAARACLHLCSLDPSLKSLAAKRYGQPLLQDKYYDHIIRNDADLDETRQYIQTNPLKWTLKQGGRAAAEGGPYNPNG